MVSILPRANLWRQSTNLEMKQRVGLLKSKRLLGRKWSRHLVCSNLARLSFDTLLGRGVDVGGHDCLSGHAQHDRCLQRLGLPHFEKTTTWSLRRSPLTTYLTKGGNFRWFGCAQARITDRLHRFSSSASWTVRPCNAQLTPRRFGTT
jgi:hypothetical protein